jgi:hypothetical protein
MPMRRWREPSLQRARRYLTIRIPVPFHAVHLVAGLVLAAVTIAAIGAIGPLSAGGQHQVASKPSPGALTAARNGSASTVPTPVVKANSGGSQKPSTTPASGAGAASSPAAPAQALRAGSRQPVRQGLAIGPTGAHPASGASGHLLKATKHRPEGTLRKPDPHGQAASGVTAPGPSLARTTAVTAMASKPVATEPSAREYRRDHQPHHEVRRSNRPAATVHLESSHQRYGAMAAKPCPPPAAYHVGRVVNHGRPAHRVAGHMA